MHSRRPRWLALLAGTAIALILGMLPAVAEFTPMPVRASDAFEFSPAAGNNGVNDLLGWSQNSHRRPRHFDTFLKVNGDPLMRVNPSGTVGYGGGFDGDRYIHQQVKNGDSNLKIYDISAGTTSNPPEGVNNQYWQWSPTHSGDWILYGENRFNRPDSPWRVFLFNTSTDERRLLASSTNRCSCIYPGQVNGNYATWSRWTGDNWDVFVHDIAGNASDLLPNPSDKDQYDGVPDTSGTVFLARSGPHCGQGVKLVRYAMGATTPTLLYSLPENRDVFTAGMYLYTGVGGEDLLFSRYPCTKNGQADIYEIADVDGPVPAAPARRRVSASVTGVRGRAAPLGAAPLGVAP